MDGYISCSNNSRLFGGIRRVTGLLVQAVIATEAERAGKITQQKRKLHKLKIQGKGRYGATHNAWVRASLQETKHRKHTNT